MNEYRFDIEMNDGYTLEYNTLAACKVAAYDNLIDYLEECGLNPEHVKVLDVYIR